jgi:2,4-diaminopentanoate dehydrogenase
MAVSGLGRLGGELILRVQESRSAELVAVVSERADALRSDPPAVLAAGVRLLDLDQALADDDIDVILDAHQFTPEDVAELYGRCAERGKDAVSSSALFDAATEIGEQRAAALDEAARRAGARLLSTGIVPGLFLDVLPSIWGAISPGWVRVSALRIGESGAWGPEARRHLGIGGEPAALEAVTPMPLTAPVVCLAAALDVVPLEIKEQRTAVVVDHDVTLGDEVFAAGVAIGFKHRAWATAEGGRTLEVGWHGIVGLAENSPGAPNGVTVEIDGALPMRMTATGAFAADSYPATAARMVHSALAMQSVRAGLLRPEEVPFGWRA